MYVYSCTGRDDADICCACASVLRPPFLQRLSHPPDPRAHPTYDEGASGRVAEPHLRGLLGEDALHLELLHGAEAVGVRARARLGALASALALDGQQPLPSVSLRCLPCQARYGRSAPRSCLNAGVDGPPQSATDGIRRAFGPCRRSNPQTGPHAVGPRSSTPCAWASDPARRPGHGRT